MYEVIIDFVAGDLNGNQLNHDTKQFGKYRQIGIKGYSTTLFTQSEWDAFSSIESKHHALIEWAKSSLEATKGFDFVSFVAVRSVNDMPNRSAIKPYINPLSREVSDGDKWAYLADLLEKANYKVVKDHKHNIKSAFFIGESGQKSFSTK